jgi:hypothetical protein
MYTSPWKKIVLMLAKRSSDVMNAIQVLVWMISDDSTMVPIIPNEEILVIMLVYAFLEGHWMLIQNSQ